MAAEEMGSVSATPMTTETMMPMKKGCSSVAHMMACPTAEAAVPTGAAISAAKPTPTSTVTIGRHQNVDLRLLADGLAQLRGNNGHNTGGTARAARVAHVVGGKPTGISETAPAAARYSARAMATAIPAYHGRAQPANGGSLAPSPLPMVTMTAFRNSMELLADGVENGSHQQRAEQSSAQHTSWRR